MAPHSLVTTAAALFGITGLGGVLMVGMRISGKDRPPAWLAMLHGVLATAALTLLLFAAWTVGLPQVAQFALVVLIFAAIGGAAIHLLFHWKTEPLPLPLLSFHGMLALVGFLFLLIAIFLKSPP